MLKETEKDDTDKGKAEQDKRSCWATLFTFCTLISADLWPCLDDPGARRVFSNSAGHLENPFTSLNKEVRPFFLSDNRIWSNPSFSSLSDYSIWRSWRLF